MKKKVVDIISRYPAEHKRAATIPLLHLAQEQMGGWLSLEAMKEVSKILEIPEMRVYEVATFYTMFQRKPVGTYLIEICTTTPCLLRDSQKILDTLFSELAISSLGDSTPDSMFTLHEVECQGACVNAPMIVINGSYYEDLTENGIKEIISFIRKNGKLPPAGPWKSGRNSCEPIPT